MSETSTDSEVLRDISGLWWVTLTLGVLSIIAGIIVLAKPSNSLATIAVITGIFVLVDGIVALLASISKSTENRGLTALSGVLDLVIGVLLIRHPIGGVTAVALFVGIWLMAMGAVRFVLAFGAASHRVWHVVIAMVEIIAGIAIVSSPGIGLATLALLIGVSLIVNGASFGMLGLALHNVEHEEAPAPPRSAAAA